MKRIQVILPIVMSLTLMAFLPGLAKASSETKTFDGNIIIADEGNDRLVLIDNTGTVKWTFPNKGDLLQGQTFKTPDDVFFSPDGQQLIVTESEHQLISIVDIATRKITYQYGVADKGSSKAGSLHNPDDAMMLADGRIVIADIANCRIFFLDPATSKTTQYGKTGSCYHQPPKRYGSPNGAFPMANGNLLVTEINGDWIDEVTLGGKVLSSIHAPGVYYPSDTNEITPDKYLTVDFVKNGQIVIFDSHGKLLWKFKPKGALALDHPSLALPLPNGKVIATDDANHRIIIVDPATSSIIWQYGHIKHAGKIAGYLNNPDGLDPVPDNSPLSTL